MASNFCVHPGSEGWVITIEIDGQKPIDHEGFYGEPVLAELDAVDMARETQDAGHQAYVYVERRGG
ncbi:hypothetical protein C4568_04370 [Candidatus Parcubacteria bacterium]|nr:MAG: hypothetical protein C4568_04370 [Candidatus Parcubacteria bacterium]